ncbi:AAA family ATPase [Longispora sp. NPDC051575]|uniref:uridine kinase family protein n=1 Tax=Longispora sp. NPDC051575 TaxID=3154943 RepID=UPI0034385B62
MADQDVVELARRVVRAEPRLGDVRVVAVDGPSGAGKTTFAERLAVAVAAEGAAVAVVHLDDLLDGWDDLPTMWPRVESLLLGPLREGRAARFRAYDWVAGEFAGPWREVDPGAVLILEGVSSGRAAVRGELVANVFVDAPEDVRLARVLARDGEELREPLRRWAEAEREHFAADGTREAATLRIAGDRAE